MFEGTKGVIRIRKRKRTDNTMAKRSAKEFEFWCLTSLSAIFQLYHGDQF